MGRGQVEYHFCGLLGQMVKLHLTEWEGAQRLNREKLYSQTIDCISNNTFCQHEMYNIAEYTEKHQTQLYIRKHRKKGEKNQSFPQTKTHHLPWTPCVAADTVVWFVPGIWGLQNFKDHNTNFKSKNNEINKSYWSSFRSLKEEKIHDWSWYRSPEQSKAVYLTATFMWEQQNLFFHFSYRPGAPSALAAPNPHPEYPYCI